MRLKSTAPFIASLVAATALSVQGISPALAADPENAGESTTETAAPVPTEAEAAPVSPEAPTPAPTTAAPAQPSPAAQKPGTAPAAPKASATPAPSKSLAAAEPAATGLLDLKILNAIVPIPFGPPLSALGLPLNVLNYNLDGPSYDGLGGPDGTQYGGEAVALYFDAHVSNLLQVKSRKLGAMYVATWDRGAGYERNLADVTAAGLRAKAVSSRTDTKPTALGHNLPEATAESRIGALVSPYLVADGIETKARVKQRDDGEWETVTEVRFARLNMSGSEYQEDDIAPNTTHVIPGLGKVVLNEQTITRLPGDRYGAKVTAIHITLAVALGGLPVGADIYISSSEAIAYE